MKSYSFLASLSGRRRSFASEGGGEKWQIANASKNHPIQGTNADIIKRVMAMLFHQLPEGASLVNAIHDEIILEVCEEQIACAERVLKQVMVTACRDFLTRVVIPEPDVLIADHWVKG